jgi:Protein of unknown function (DUF2786)
VTAEREGLIRKVQALMAKTVESNCTEAEALAALNKARAMIDAYEVTDAELQLTREEKAILRREPEGTKDPHRIKWFLCGAVAKFCDCSSWRNRRDEGGGLTFCGLPSDAQFATWLLDTLTTFVQIELVEHLMDVVPNKEDKREVIRGFVLGCTERINERLDELCKRSVTVANENARALVVVKDAAVKAKLCELGITFRSASSSCSSWDGSSFQAGKAAGNRASFGRPVSGRNAALRLR